MTKIINLFNQIHDFYWYNLGYRVRYFRHGLYNLYRWLPTVWRDRDYDDYFIFEILKVKLKNQAEHIKKSNNHTTASRDAQRMLLCVSLIDKIQNDFYSVESFEYCLSDIDSETQQIDDNYDNYLNKHKSAVNRILKNKDLQIFKLTDCEYKKRLTMNLGYYNEKRAQDLLFTILNREIRGWWC